MDERAPAGRHARVFVAVAPLQQAAGALDAFCAAEQLPPDVAWRLRVALDEIVANIVAHAAPGAESDALDVWFRYDGAAVEITIADDGPAFDPLAHPAPNTTQPLQVRQPGGVGIALVRSLMDDVRYERTTRNVLTLRKRIDSAGEAGTDDIEHSNRDGVIVVAPSGRIDSTTSGAVAEAVRRAVDEGARHLVVDFARAEYISSAGLGVFLVLAKRMRDLKGRLVLCGMLEPVRQVFHLAGFMPLFEIERSRDAAVAKFATET